MEQVFRYIEENRERYINWLQELCRKPSVSTENRGIKEAADLVQKLLLEIGAKVEVIETNGHPILYGEISQGRSRTISFYNHYDVQPEHPIEAWVCDPFAAEIQEGKLIARGSADNKGALVARICAVHAYQQVYGELPVNLKFIIEGEEESGSKHIQEFAQSHPEKFKADLCIWENGIVNEDGSFEVKLGNKGILYVHLVAKGANTDLHSSNAAIIENPAWRLIWALNSLKNEQEEVLIDGFYDRVQKPNEVEKRILEEMDFEEEQMLNRLGLKQFLLNCSGTELKERLLFQPTCTICGLVSGYEGEGTKTVLPSTARVSIDFRLVPDQDPEEILKLLRKHLDRSGFEDIEVIATDGTPPAKTDPGHPLVQKIITAAEKLNGIPPRVIIMNPGSGPMYKLCQQFGIPAAGFGVGNPDSKKHAPNENILIKDYMEGIKMAALVIDELGLQDEK
ncbi:M20/M25/M40 family metallo-hydrolase [Brevibacillus sp. B_LB10_24]|uniref:M20/M25/M40 family metallo-hydrolase n=1 Tax=Brevibacillus sp. B_LB10_24 TaxID=3380645 RepID=UPI0038B7B5D8